MKNLISPQIIVGLYAIAAIAVTSAGMWVYSSVYNRGYQAASLVHEKKQAEQQAANDKAIAITQKGLREDMASLKLQKEKLEDEIARLNDEAVIDPHATTGGIKRSSVQRINSIR